MNKSQVINELEITEEQLDLLEYDFLKIHKDYMGIVDKPNVYPKHYIESLREWKGKRTIYLTIAPLPIRNTERVRKSCYQSSL